MLWIEVDGPPEGRTIPAKVDRPAMELWSQPAILLQEGTRGTVMFELSIESRENAYEVGVKYALDVRAFEKGDYGALSLGRRFKLRPVETAARPVKSVNA